jgi:non-specific serine/threonine protein kinase
MTAGARQDMAYAAPRLLPSSTLPVKPTSFVGRGYELAELPRRLETTHLLSLVGPGGIGKTRLALEVAARLTNQFVDGVFLVDLAPLTTTQLVMPAVARAVGLRVELDREPHSAIFTYLAPRQLLLLVDNCEHLLDACAELIVPLLQHCAGVTILATSREPFGVEGEIVWRLEPLEDAAATELFIERARAQRANFDPGDRATITQLCHAIDNLPLAVELAAARVNVLTPAEVLQGLDQRFELLKRPRGHGVAPRQQTLRATVEWSFGLLNPPEQQLFRRLSVFAGPFDLAAANTMGGADTLDVLARLVDKSLVMASATEHRTQYRLLETLRDFASEQLRDTGEIRLARQRHLNHFLGLAESTFRVNETLDGPTRQLDRNFDDLRGALEWCDMSDPEAGLRLVGATRSVWFRRDYSEGRRWAERFLARCSAPNRARALALVAAGDLAGLSDPSAARRFLTEAAEIARHLDDREILVMANILLGLVALLDESPEDALKCLECGVVLAETLGDGGALGRVLLVLSMVLLTQPARREEGRQCFERARAISAPPNEDRYIAAVADYCDGLYLRRTSRRREALARFQSAARTLHLLGDSVWLSFVLFEIGRLALQGDPMHAARLASAGITVGTRVGIRWQPRQVRTIDGLRHELLAGLGAEQLEAAWRSGEHLSAEEAVTVALTVGHPVSTRPGGLSPRELEVARLVAQGRSSTQVADVLQLSPRTVDNHLARIFNKLGVSTRVQLATWMAGHGQHE